MPEPLHLPFTTSHAFLIGINEYEHISSLGTAVKDVTDIAELLKDEKKHGYEVHLITDAGKKEMEAFFQKMTEVVEAEDRVMFYYAGHGIAIDSEGDPKGYLVPADAEPDNTDSLVPMKLLHETLKNLPCKHGLLVLDCCFAGAFKWSTGYRAIHWGSKEVLYAERFLRFVEFPAWQVITSSAKDQKAADILNKKALGLRDEEENKDKNSPFAWAFKQAIDTDSKADSAGYGGSDGVITATELYNYIREIVETATLSEYKRQSPAIFTLGRHNTKGEYIFLNPGHRLNLPQAPDINPYKGLIPYEANKTDADTFFGRKKAIKQMTNKLQKSSVLVVSAPSGQGKSSVVKAGLFPSIQKEKSAVPLILRPGERIIPAWEALSKIPEGKEQIILIDQYEEMFDLEEKERNFFERVLIDLLEKTAKGTHTISLILTIRSDFEWQLKTSHWGQHFWKESNIRDFLYRLAPMTQEELREIMVKPAWAVAYEFESEELINQILEEINHSPGALPLLSFTLHKLYKKGDRDKRLLTKKAYAEELGGVNGALSKHADEIYEALPSDQHKDFMRKLMLRMVRLNDGNYSRRRVYLNTPSRITDIKTIDELDYPDHLDEVKDQVLLALEESLLVIRDKDKYGIYVEPMHDSLLNFWPTCLQWIQDFGRENIVLQRQLWQAVVEHHQWKKGTYTVAGGREEKAPLWDNNPKLQQVQIAVTDPKNAWLCNKSFGNHTTSSFAYLLWEQEPLEEQMQGLSHWQEYFDGTTGKKLYAKIQSQMDHWLNEEELAFIKQSFEAQQSELERAIAERNEAIKAKELAEAREKEIGELLNKMAIRTQAFKSQYQNQAKKDYHFIKEGFKPDLHLILVGINEYAAPIPALRGCVSDVEEMAKAFQSQEGKLYKKVHPYVLTDSKASKENIFKEVEKVKAKAKISDFVIVFLVGHGATLENGDGCFLSYNPKGRTDFSGKEMCTNLMQFPCKVILILDIVNGAEFLSSLAEANKSDKMDQLAHNVFGLSGCSPGELAYEININGKNRGAFSYALEMGFTSQEADLDGNGVVYLDEMVQYTADIVRDKAKNQNVFAVAPSTMTNIPLLQHGDTFSLPKKEMALSGHISDDHVIESIMTQFPDLNDLLKEHKGNYESLLHRLLLESHT